MFNTWKSIPDIVIAANDNIKDIIIVIKPNNLFFDILILYLMRKNNCKIYEYQ